MLDWLKTGKELPEGDNFTPLRIVSSAMCCALGHDQRAAVAGIEARVNHFRETQFVCDEGMPIMGGALFSFPVWGQERLARVLAKVVPECLAGAPDVSLHKVALMLLCAQSDQSGPSESFWPNELAALQKRHGFGDRPKLCRYGKAGIAQVLQEAAQALGKTQGLDHVLLVGIDSLLDAGVVETLLEQERVATRRNADGLIPAEGAGAILLTRRSPAPTALSAASSLWIEGVADANEVWQLGSDTPARALGLTQAMRAASAMAKTPVAELDFHASGMTGEGWYAKEVSMALSRCMEHRKNRFEHLTIASYLGETGAASAVLTMAWLAQVMPLEDDGPGKSALLHFASDSGQRAALVVRMRSDKNRSSGVR
jgi:3-oxoacyl-[acyl-carrier-protein] synthase I